jgi:hypothetical protein
MNDKPKLVRVKTQFSRHHDQIGVVIREDAYMVIVRFDNGDEAAFGRSAIEEIK